MPPSTSGSTSTAALPRCRLRNARYSPFGVWTRSSADDLDAVLGREPDAAGVGVPSGLKPADTGGPLTSSSRSVCRSGIRAMRTVSRRGVLKVSAGASGASRCARSCADDRLADLVRQRRQPDCRQLLAADLQQQFAVHQPAPSPTARSAVSCSARRTPSRCRRRAAGRAGCSAVRSVTPMLLLESRMLNRCEHFRQCSSAGQMSPDRSSASREPVVLVEQSRWNARELARRQVDTCAEDVLRLLDFLAQPDVAVLHARRPLEVVDAVDPLQHHRDALEAVGQLRRDRRQLDPAGLLEVGELRDLQAVEQHLPADAPGAERRRLPVVLLEADVVLPRD